jgi:hypothetical protein
MTSLNTLRIENGLIEGIADFISLLVPFSEEGMPGRSEKLSNLSSIQPATEDLSIMEKLLAGATMELKTLEARKGAETRRTEATKETEGETLKYTAAVEKYDMRMDKLEKARKGAETRRTEATKEMELIVAAFNKAIPSKILTRLISTALSIGSRATDEGLIVTPGAVVEAMKRYEEARIRPTILECLASMTALIKALEKKLQGIKPQEAWPQLLLDLHGWHRKMGDQVGGLTAPIVGRLICESVEKALATPGARPVLTQLLEHAFGDGRVGEGTVTTWRELLDALQTPEVYQEAIINLARLVHPAAGSARLAAGGEVKSNMCFAFKRGECTRGAGCRFSHGDGQPVVPMVDGN